METDLGNLTACAEDGALIGLWFAGQKYYPAETDDWLFHSNYPIFEKLRNWLSGYFSGNLKVSRPRLNPRGSTFQKNVWNRILRIPFGELSTYGNIARTLGVHSPRAIGNAVGHNPISLLIPCHRVVGADGNLRGYAGGIEKKVQLLQLEKYWKNT
ncbi:MAG: methylated-DNA--[protein]-cysteine S-methyltransferase [Puniceicoccales bacterium]|jgi:methylated-DNA-[protein]-cysteine S-methyltransferase|nr:methylated-DNA--[protein]-cysteine S-methyltransferase [Puniceicoccales bacterium]